MGIGSKMKNMSTKEKVVTSVIAAVVLIAAVVVVCVIVSRNNMLATTMRLLRVQGTVSIEDSKGVTKPVIDNLRFKSGDALNTGSDGLASVGLDDAKIVTLQNDSRAEFRKKNKQLELKLTKGAVFFNVTEKLKDDEKFEIKTSTMTAGIRGTSGIIYYDSKDANRETVAITDGTVIVSATNPETNETRSVEVVAGKKVQVYFYVNDGVHDNIEFELNDFKPEELMNFTLNWMADNDDLLKRISDHTGWDKDNLKKILKGIASGDVKPPKESETPTPTNTPTPEPPTSTPTPTPTPVPTKKPTPTKRPTKKPTPTKRPTKRPTKAPAIPKSVPSGYNERIVWDTSKKIFIVAKYAEDEENFVEYLKGYLNGKWITLYYSEAEEGGGLHCWYYYIKNGKKPKYYEYYVR